MSDTVIPANFGKIYARNAQEGPTYTIVPSDEYVVAINDVAFTLPAADSVPPGWAVRVGNASPSANTVTIARASGDTIGGAAGNLTLATTAVQVLLISDGVSNWETIRPGT